MYRMTLPAVVLCLAAALGAGAYAAPSGRAAAGPNPVVDVSALMNPGRWHSRLVTTVNGRQMQPRQHVACFTPANLEDFLNASDMPRVSAYDLDGNRLSYEFERKVDGRIVSQATFVMVFDGPNHGHGTMHASLSWQGTRRVTVVKYESRRTGPCSGAGAAND